jgi:hypothetical protein
MMNTLTLSSDIITILSSVKKVSLPREDDYGRLAAVFVTGVVAEACNERATGSNGNPHRLKTATETRGFPSG